MSRRVLFALAAVIAAGLVLASILMSQDQSAPGAGSPIDRPIRVGVLAPFNTPDGDGIVNGVTMAVDEINARGGVMGRKLEIVALNTDYSAEKAVAAFEQLVGPRRVDAVVGLSTAGVFGILPLLEHHRTPVLCTGVGANKLTELVEAEPDRYRPVFRVMHRSEELGAAVEDFIVGELVGVQGFRRFAIMVEDDVWTAPIRERWERRIAEVPGASVVYSGTFSHETTDFVPLLAEIMKRRPDYILDAASMVDATTYIKQWAELQGPPLGAIPTGAGTKRYFDELGERGGGVASIATIPSEINVLTPSAPEWWRRYRSRFGDPEYTSAYSYDAVFILASAVERAGGTQPDALLASLEATSLDGVVGHWEFGPGHHPKFGAGFRRIPMIQYDRPGERGFHVLWPPEVATAGFSFPVWDARAAAPTPSPVTDEVRLVRTECFGTCPAYSVVIRGDGSVTYEGRKHVKVNGTATTALPASKVAELFAAVEKARLFELDDEYSTKCPEFWTDNPSEVITVRLGSRTKTVSRNFGCRGLRELERVDALCDRIDEITATKVWVGR